MQEATYLSNVSYYIDFISVIVTSAGNVATA